MILAVSLTASMTTTIELRRYNSVKEDLILLTEEVKAYYLRNGSLPVDTSQVFESTIISSKNPADMNPNDEGSYYPINYDLLDEDVKLNNGAGNKNKNYRLTDLFIVNEKSYTVYYLAGVKLDNKTHYTIVDDFSGGSYANEYYSEVELPIISAVTLESNGITKSKAGVGDTVTLRILTNGTLASGTVAKIDNTPVNLNPPVGNIVTATLKITSVTKEEKISISISGYSTNGKTITDVTMGNSVYKYIK